MAKELKFVLLLDCYGELLTNKQREYMELYYCEDLSLSEISQPQGITRQAVRDVIKRSEQILLDMENQLGFAKKIVCLRKYLNEIKSAAAVCENQKTAETLDLLVDKCLEII